MLLVAAMPAKGPMMVVLIAVIVDLCLEVVLLGLEMFVVSSTIVDFVAEFVPKGPIMVVLGLAIMELGPDIVEILVPGPKAQPRCFWIQQ